MVVTHSILVVTPLLTFGELIQQALEDTGVYRVLLVDSGLEALTCARNIPFSLAILDHHQDGGNLTDLVNHLKTTCVDLSLLVFLPDNDPQHPALAHLPLDGTLSKSFDTPDLLKAVSEILSRRDDEPPSRTPGVEAQSHLQVEPAPGWLQDKNHTAEYLSHYMLVSPVQAVIILCQAEAWAVAGQLVQPSINELTSTVTQLSMPLYSDSRIIPSHLPAVVKTVRLETAGKEVLLYLKSLNRETVLAMAFDPETPLSTVRAQANHLVGSLSRLSEIQPTKSTSYSSAWRVLTHPNDQLSSTVNTEEDEEESDGYAEELDDLPLAISLPEILDDIPSPVPAMPPQASPVPGQPEQLTGLSTSTPGGSQSSPPLNQALTPGELRPVTPAVHSLYYVCLMIPRLPHHLLVGALSRQLNGAVSQLCLAYGWRLEYIAVRPDYLLWIVNLSPLTSPNYLMRILRQKTSGRIFESFPDLIKDNPSGDFWAPGYLIMSGSQPPSTQIIRDFIHKTRDHQGIHLPARLEV